MGNAVNLVFRFPGNSAAEAVVDSRWRSAAASPRRLSMLRWRACMTKPACLPRLYPLLMALWGLVVAVMAPALAQTPEQLALQQVIAGDPVLEPYYRGAEFQLLWSANDPVAVQRRQAFTAALRAAGEHGLPLARYDPDRLAAQAGTARQPLQHARAEAAYTRAFLRYARDLQSGVLDPAQVDEGIKRMAPRRDPLEMLRAFASRPAAQYLAALPPQTWQYRRLVEEKSRLEAQVIHGWGPVVPSGLAPEHAGVPVLALRQRLAAQGYDLPPEAGGAEPRFDPALVKTVQQFQRDHGLNPDGHRRPGDAGGAQQDATGSIGIGDRGNGARTLDEQGTRGPSCLGQPARFQCHDSGERARGPAEPGGDRQNSTSIADAGILRPDVLSCHQSQLDGAALDHRS